RDGGSKPVLIASRGPAGPTSWRALPETSMRRSSDRDDDPWRSTNPLRISSSTRSPLTRVRSMGAAAERPASRLVGAPSAGAAGGLSPRSSSSGGQGFRGAFETMTQKLVIHGDGSIQMDRYVEEIVALLDANCFFGTPLSITAPVAACARRAAFPSRR